MSQKDELTAETRIWRRPGLSVRQVGEDVFVLDLNRHRFHRIAGAGIRIWELLAEPTTLGELVARLQEEFDADPERVRADCETFVARLLGEDLLRTGAAE